MKFVIKPHALEKMGRRSIPKWLVAEALSRPTKIMYDREGRLMFKKLYTKNNEERLLLVVVEIIRRRLEVITVIETSKVRKYL